MIRRTALAAPFPPAGRAKRRSRYDRGMTGDAGVPGTAVFEAWLRRLPGWERARVATIERAGGGASNLTCRVGVSDGPHRSLALRLQRERGIFEPYDVLREGRVLAALAGSGIPVPRLIASESDPVQLGAPFIVMDWIDAPHMGVAGHEAGFASYVGMVVRIHQLDWAALGLGLGLLGVPAGAAAGIAAELDVSAWRMARFGCADDALLAAALERLRATVPANGHLALCQGDINAYNYLFRAGRVVGVVDWEQARIGDPRTDAGQMVALSHLKGMPFCDVQETTFVQAYQERAGTWLSDMHYFRAFWLFQLGVIHQGWLRFNDSQPWYSRAQLDDLLSRSLAEL